MAISVTNREVQPARARPLLPFYAGAVLDVLIGLDLLLFGPALAALFLPGQETLLGAATGTVFRVLGAALMVFGLETFLLARSGTRRRRFLPAIVAANWAWVGASALILVVDAAYFSAVGIVAVGLLALATASLALLQSRALKASS